MIQQIYEYKKILDQVEVLLDKSPFKKGYIVEKVGISAPTFYRKIKDKTFTPDELLKIAKLIKPEEAILYELQQSERDYEEGNVIEHNEFMKQLRKEFL